MKKMILSLLAALFALTLSAAASANQTATGTITQIYVENTGAMFFFPSAVSSGTTSCVNAPNSFVVDSTTAAGKTIAAALQLAFAAGRTVNFYGDGTCSVWPGRETIQYIILN